MKPERSFGGLFVAILILSFLVESKVAFGQTITLAPNSGNVGASVTVNGLSFGANRQVSVSFDGARVGNGTTSSTGSFSLAFAVPSSSRGPHTVSADDGISSASATFTVTNSLSRSPTSGVVGTTISLTGYGYSASGVITIKWDGTVLATSPSTVVTDSAGAFVATVLAPPCEPVSHSIVASDSGGSVTVTFTISRSIALSPSLGPVGTLALVTGSGYLASNTIIITFDGSAVPTTPATVISDFYGGFVASFNVPSVSPGAHTVRGIDNVGGSATATFTVTPSISLSSSSGRGGTSITVTGTGFASSNTVAIRFDGNLLLNFPTDLSGGFSATVTIPLAPAGGHVISATDGLGSTASASFSVTPSISLSPANGAVGTIVTVTGVGFAGSSTVTLLFAGNPVVTTPTPILTDAFGGFIASFTAPLAPASGWSVLAVDGSGFRAAATFTITRRLSLSATSGIVEATIIVRGTGFAPSTQIVFTFDGAPLVTTPSPVTSDSNGRFNASFAVPESIQGTHTIVVDDLSGGIASTTFTISNSITISPTSGNVGDTIVVVGRGFAQNSLVTISYDGSSVVTVPGSVETNSLGSFSASFAAVASSAGTHTVRAADLFGNTATATFTVIRKITLSSRSGAPLVGITITGVGFAGLSGITLTWDGGPLTALPSPITTNATGYFLVILTVPLDTAGKHTVVATDGVGNTASDTYTISASIAVTPSGLSVGDELWVSGIGFSGSSTISITWDGIQVSTEPPSISTDSIGGFTASFLIPPSRFGTHRVVAVDQSGNWSSSSYTISSTSAISVEMDVGAIYFRGEVVEFYALVTQNGKPFDASTVTAKLFRPGGAVQDLSGAVVRVDTGTYRIDYTVPGGAAPGTYALVVNVSKTISGVSSFGSDLRAFEISDTFGRMNATITAINNRLATISIDIGPVLLKLDEVNASISSLITTSKGEVLAQISSTAGIMTSKLDLISASLSSIQNGMATISTSFGTVQVELTTINARIDSLKGDMALVRSTVGSLNVSLTNLNPKISSISGNVLTLQTDLGVVHAELADLKARSISIENGLVRIETGVGRIIAGLEKLTGITLPVKTQVSTKLVTLFTDMELTSIEYRESEQAIRFVCNRGAQSSGALSFVITRDLLNAVGSSISKMKIYEGGQETAFSSIELKDAYLLQVGRGFGQHELVLYLNGLPSIFSNPLFLFGVPVLLLGVCGIILFMRRKGRIHPSKPRAYCGYCGAPLDTIDASKCSKCGASQID